jgi:hypothetical protein
VTVALPELDSAKALQSLARIDRSQGLLAKGIKSLDLRFPGELVVELSEPLAPEKDVKNFKVSQQQ